MSYLELRFTDREITPWGGMALMKRLLDHLGFERALSEVGLPPQGSNRGYAPEQLIGQFMLSVWCGANRFQHAEITRQDAVLQRIFGWRGMAQHKAFERFFNKFDQASCERVFGRWYRWLHDQMQIDGLTLDLDSTIVTRYGAQEGAVTGRNPNKPGRPSQHPLMAFIAETQTVANLWLRPGNTNSAHNVVSFLDSTLFHLGDKRCRLLRADSGFSDARFLSALETRRLPYVIALNLIRPLQRALAGQAGWWPIDEPGAEGLELATFMWQCASWATPRRVVAVRQSLRQRPTARGKTLSLFARDSDLGSYRYGAFVTDLDLPALAIWRLYRGRSDCENRIKELKYDFGAASFNLRGFWATEASLSTVMMAYNLMSLLRKALLKTLPRHMMKTLRYQLFGVAGMIGQEGRRPILRLAMATRRRLWFTGLWEQSASFPLPVQFDPLPVSPAEFSGG